MRLVPLSAVRQDDTCCWVASAGLRDENAATAIFGFTSSDLPIRQFSSSYRSTTRAGGHFRYLRSMILCDEGGVMVVRQG